jgi:hypothetical protein
VESDLDELSGRRKCIVYFGYHKENFEEFREREAVRQIHITRFLQQIVSGLQRRSRERRKDEEENE